MDVVKAIANDDERQLVCQLRFLCTKTSQFNVTTLNGRERYRVLVRTLNSAPGNTDLEEVLDALRVVAVALATDALHLFDLPGFARRLDVLEVNLRILREVDDRSEEVEQTCQLKGDMALIFTTPQQRPDGARYQDNVFCCS